MHERAARLAGLLARLTSKKGWHCWRLAWLKQCPLLALLAWLAWHCWHCWRLAWHCWRLALLPAGPAGGCRGAKKRLAWLKQ